ncbi:uncharacterized protein LOC114960826 isoform X2 [Acropora millepora]|uniref:uncharacterized protein LOC114960826 isoform X2 n=1 Tax=Acropora millepora TaxID=45264 RepID=UPI001CF4120B|nr:uncharacterized protein LOC114960826 isoform X2 [Acropora millepora]
MMTAANVVLVLATSLFIVVISEAAIIKDRNKRNTQGLLALGVTKRSVGNEAVCQPYDQVSPQGYCKHILGNLPVFGTKQQLQDNEQKMRRYELLKTYFKSLPNSSPYNYKLRQSCVLVVDDIYCHNYFKRCYISSAPQPVCRDFCEDTFLKVCDREIKIAEEFNKRKDLFLLRYYWEIINCTTLPYRNETSNCYYPDVIQEKLNVLKSEECFYGNGRGYSGSASTTASGYECQSWNATTFRESGVSEAIYADIKNSSNLCRNPVGFALDGPWCFTKNETLGWEYCNVSRCAKEAPSSPPLDFRGYNVSSTSIMVTWGDVPKSSVNGVVLGYHVTCTLSNSSEAPKIESLKNHNGVFTGLKEYRRYTFSVRAYNNFGNGTWSEKLVISTDEDAPSAPPQSLKAWNLTSTSLRIQWSPIPIGERNGRFLGYIVEIKPAEGREGEKLMKNLTTYTNITFRGLKKYFKYKVEVRGLTQRGQGPIKAVTVQTDEDVPDRPPSDISTSSLGSSIIELEWSPVPPEYANGKVLGYKVIISGGNGTLGKNRTITTTRTFYNIEKLTPSTIYSFQVLAFTAKGDGARSNLHFAKTGPDGIDPQTVTPQPRNKAGVITAAVLSSMAALAAILIAVWFIKYKKRAVEIDNRGGNGPMPAADVQPYARSSPDWLETIISSPNRHYEPCDNENSSITRQRPRCYGNLAPDGSVNLAPHLRNIFLEFERYYENTRYKRLRRRRYRLFGQTPGDAEGHLLYDRLQREMPARSVSSVGFNISADKTPATEFHEEHRRRWTSLDELRFHREPVYDEIVRCESPEMGAEIECTLKRHRRRFSIDLGEVREFIAITGEMLSSAEENTASFTEPEIFEREDIC